MTTSRTAAAAAPRLGAGRHVRSEPLPDATRTSLYELSTADGATVTGTLRTVPGATTVVCIMHPRQDQTHHPLVPLLLRGGAAVWTQVSRSVNNDLALVHEQALLDVAAGLGHLRDLGFEGVVDARPLRGRHPLRLLPPAGRAGPRAAGGAHPGRSADRPARRRPAPGRRRGLPRPAPGSGAAAARLHRPVGLRRGRPAVAGRRSSTSTTRPTASPTRRRAPGTHRSSSGATAAPSTTASPGSTPAPASGSPRPRRRAPAGSPRATPGPARGARPAPDHRLPHRCRPADRRPVPRPERTPLRLAVRPRPDLINYGLVGFGRLTTPDAWLSTWSGLSTNADFVRCAPGVTAPTLFVELTGDQAAFPADSRAMLTALGSADLTAESVRGTHFGGPVEEGAAPRLPAGRGADPRVARSAVRTGGGRGGLTAGEQRMPGPGPDPRRPT